MDRRIATQKGLDAVLEQLSTKLPGESFPLFETKQKALMFAAALGRRMCKRTPLTQREAGTAIRPDIFQKAMDDAFLSALAIAEKGDLGVLADEREDELATVFEEYAHTGLLELQRRCLTGMDPLNELVDMVLAAREQAPPSELPGLDPDILSGILRGR